MQTESLWSKIKNFFVNTTYEEDYDDHHFGSDVEDEGIEHGYGHGGGYTDPTITSINDFREGKSVSRRHAVRDDISIQTKRNPYAENETEENSGLISELTIREPKNIEDAYVICDLVAEGKGVTIKLDKTVATAENQRIMDFISGARYALAAEIRQDDTHMFVIAPKGLKLSQEHEEQLKSHGMLNFMRKSKI